MKTLGGIRCPGCGGAMVPVEMRCEACEVAMRGRFGANEFACLGDEELHFLRIFVLCEGHIREMESALGVSYPTIKSRLAKLKATLAERELPKIEETAKESQTAAILRKLESGTISFDEAIGELKAIRKEGDL